MVTAFVHVRKDRQASWVNEYHQFSRLPVVGEYFTLQATGEWYRVGLVIHTPFEGEQLAGEIYAEAVDHLEEMRRAFPS